ncbi:MAG: TonB-dependent receptor, partial [Opitutaceae bacterium]
MIAPAALAAAEAAPAVLKEVVVSAARAPQPAEHAAATVRVLTADDLARGPAATLDGALRAIPAFGLFRRADSLAANPTAQGVSLRGLGPSGASRSLVLLDGVPLNDPFGGWVAWTTLPRDGAWRAEIVPGGGATAWGNAALGGVVLFLTAPDAFSPLQANTPTARLSASAGSFGTREAEFSATTPDGGGEARLLGRDFSTDGYTWVAPERRGSLDPPAWSRHRWLAAGWRRAPGEANIGVAVNARAFDETRGNGPPSTRNRSREHFASVALGGRPDAAFGWDAVAYAQDQTFASTFSSVNAARSAETPASDERTVASLKSIAASRVNFGDGRHAAVSSRPSTRMRSRLRRWSPRPPAGRAPTIGNVPGPRAIVTLATASRRSLVKPTAEKVRVPAVGESSRLHSA